MSAVFYPVDVLPVWLQPIARLFPSTHVFEGMRAVLKTGHPDWSSMFLAFGLNLVFLLGAGLYFGWMLARVKKRGLLTRVATQ